VGRAGAARARKRPRRPPPSALAPAEPVSDHPFAKLVSLRLELRRAGDVGLADGDAWVHELVEAPFERFLIDREARISADGRLLGQLTRGPDRLRPEVRLLLPDDVGAGARSRLQRRLVAWSRDLIAELCAPLRAAPDIARGAAARGLLYQLEQGLGTVPVSSAAREVEHLTAADRAQLTGSGSSLVSTTSSRVPCSGRERSRGVWRSLRRRWAIPGAFRHRPPASCRCRGSPGSTRRSTSPSAMRSSAPVRCGSMSWSAWRAP
jgi:hypothetical protein